MKRLLFAVALLACVVTGGISGQVSADKKKNPVVEMRTNYGNVLIELYPDKTPITVKNFLDYVDDKFYDKTIFHRVMPGFVNQGGGYLPGLKRKKTRGNIKNEAKTGLSNKRGTIAMARLEEPDTASSQFFINIKDNTRLDAGPMSAGYTAFGKVIKGMEVMDKINKVETRNIGRAQGVPVKDVVIYSIRRVKK